MIAFIEGTTVNGYGGVSVILDVPNLISFALTSQKQETTALFRAASINSRLGGRSSPIGEINRLPRP